MDSAGIVVETDQRVELVLRCRCIADRFANMIGMALDIFDQSRIGLGLGSYGSCTDVRSGSAPANRPGFAAGAGIGVCLNSPVRPYSRQTFEPFDQGKAFLPYRSNRYFRPGQGLVDSRIQIPDVGFSKLSTK